MKNDHGVLPCPTQTTILPPPRGDASHVIDPRDESLIVAALEREPATKDIGALRTRAFYYLLRDGALRTKA
ncbi:MAG TPA: hypothetical protein VF331_01850, partial [Polyangiales bacterium]